MTRSGARVRFFPSVAFTLLLLYSNDFLRSRDTAKWILSPARRPGQR